MADEVAQETGIGADAQAEGFTDGQIGVEVPVEIIRAHGVPPIQGSATPARVSRSSLA